MVSDGLYNYAYIYMRRKRRRCSINILRDAQRNRLTDIE